MPCTSPCRPPCESSGAIRAAEAGKHVLVENRWGPPRPTPRKILAACQRQHVQFMDGVMFLHSRRLAAIRAVLDDGQSVGQIKRITSQFTFGAGREFFENDIRVNSELEPLGCLRRLGLVQHRPDAVDHERAVARAGLRPRAGRAWPPRQSCGRPHGLLGRAVLPRRSFGQLLLLVPGRDPAVGHRKRDQRAIFRSATS